jgi:phosphate/sulfate permease
MNYIVLALGILTLLAASICVFTYSTTHSTVKLLIGICLLLILVFLLLEAFKHRDSLKLHAIYLKWSTKLFDDRKLSVVYILIFIVILAGFIGLTIFEFTGFWTAGHLSFDPNHQVYHEIYGVFPTVMSFFLIVQIIWGLTFIK